jgi:RimJ/RimL family protein N-acetyltransferase
MDFGKPVVTVRCNEPEGTFDRAVTPVALSTEKLRYYYDKLKEFDVVFNDHVPNTPGGFASIFVTVSEDLTVSANGLLWEVDDVGILYLTHIIPGLSALAHFSFWDRRLRGREELVRRMIQYCFLKYRFQRIETRVALYANPVLAAVERIGFVKEGRARKAVRRGGDWYDVNLYAMLREEAVENGT